MRIFLFILGIVLLLGLGGVAVWGYITLKKKGYKRPTWSDKNKVFKWFFDNVPNFVLIGAIVSFGFALVLLAILLG